MSAPYCFVTVQTAERRVDLTLPMTVPVVELTPAVAQLCGADPADHPAPAWTLARVGSPAVDLSATLADSAVRDGEVLHLVEASRWRGPVVVDIAETVNQVVEATARRWSATSRAWLLAGLAVAHLMAAAAVIAVCAGGRVWALPAACAAAALIGTPAVLPQLAGASAVRFGCASGGLVLAAFAGWSAASGMNTAGVLAGMGLAVSLAALGAIQTLQIVAPGLALVGVTVGASAGAVTAGARPAQAAAVVVVLGVLALRALPRTLARRLSTRVAGREADAVGSTARQSLRLLASLSAGICLCVLVAGLTLTATGGASADALAAGAATALVLRARSFRFVTEIAPPMIAAGGILIAVETAIGTKLLANPGVSIALLLVTGVALLVLAAWRHGSRRPVGAGGSMVGRLVDAALLPLALATMGVFSLITRVAQSLGH